MPLRLAAGLVVGLLAGVPPCGLAQQDSCQQGPGGACEPGDEVNLMQQALDVATGKGIRRPARGELVPWYMMARRQRQEELARLADFANFSANFTATTSANFTANSSANVIANSSADLTANSSANFTANSSANATAGDVADAASNATNVTAGRNLVFMHIPFNFGHTVEAVAMFDDASAGPAARAYLAKVKPWGATSKVHWGLAREAMRAGGEVWGHLNPDLQRRSHVTGCPLFFTPQKHWPESLARRYFGRRKVFGLLRDPYERLVAMFRSNISGYGGSYPQFRKTCDVNGAVKQMMRSYLAGDKYAQSCTFLPQAEYFDGPYGIRLPVDNREFPRSMNDVFRAEGYPDFSIAPEEVLHVSQCPEVWAGDLDPEARSLVRQVYARDFDLLCRHFGHCDRDESTCLYQVPQMCPRRVLEQGYRSRARPASE